MAVAELQPLLRADETVVAYHSLPDRLLVWMVDRERVRERSLPVPRADLEQLVDAWRDAFVHGQTAAVGAGGQTGEQNGRAKACTPDTNAHLVCSPLLEKK